MSDERVRAKLRDIIAENFATWSNGIDNRYDMLAHAIYKSPDLQVTLAEPRYKVSRTFNSPNHLVVDNRTGGAICEFYESAGYAEENARHLADWLNSKEQA